MPAVYFAGADLPARVGMPIMETRIFEAEIDRPEAQEESSHNRVA